MAAIVATELNFHEGEREVHRLMAVPDRETPAVPYLSPGAGMLMMTLRTLALGTVDQQGRIWTTIWGVHAGTYPMFAIANLAQVRKLSMRKFHESPGFLPART